MVRKIIKIEEAACNGCGFALRPAMKAPLK